MHVKRHFAKLIFVFGLVYALYVLGRNYGSTKPTVQLSHWKRAKDALWILSDTSADEEFYFKLEKKLKFMRDNVEHRTDYVRAQFTHLLQYNSLMKGPLEAAILSLRKRAVLPKALLEKLFLLNKYKESRLKAISQRIQDRISQLQERKCPLNQIVYCSLENECGYGCHLHTMSVAFMLSYYWKRTLIYAKNHVAGMEDYENIFLPVAQNCRLHNLENETIYQETIRPVKVYLQVKNGERFIERFQRDLSKIFKYHEEPAAFLIGHLMSYILRYNTSSNFYKMVQEAGRKFNLQRPYVGVHIRRSDKSYEARLFPSSDYMTHVDEFFETYSIKYPHLSKNLSKDVYVASDEPGIFRELEQKYPDYRFVYNNTYTNMSSTYKTRYFKEGFESLLFDLYFLSNADYLVCTFTSNICRLAYELMLTRLPDSSRLVKSLDLHYYNYFEMTLYQVAVVKNDHHEFPLRPGTLIEKYFFSGHSYEGYRHDGTTIGRITGTGQGGVIPSYKARDFY